ncbi:VOC family protein [Actinomadura sp. KC216]|uniref:VOC family protein n=1 Tax=Actinomadura sp. KC216 TaxID=2530370 RepID=UPI001044B542|nr:VOC family protein [Actinomadura sp. KC216]TDB81527.1 VOC family protein [Actinomadura sp. KC216]
MPPPSVTGLSHLSLSVTDRDKSVQWYGDILGFTPFHVQDDDRWLETICILPDGLTVLGLVQHRDATGPFDHRRTGLDHLAFAVPDRAALDRWYTRLTDLGVTCSPVAETPFGPVLCFRDPDDIQLELFAIEPAAPPADRLTDPPG